jgi:predicted O-methyltransferase YrrM
MKQRTVVAEPMAWQLQQQEGGVFMETHTMFGDLADFIDARYAPEDALLQDLKAQTRQRGLPPIQIPPALGKLLALLVKISGAHRILEIGTLAGYSAIWMARALPANGRLVSLEVESAHKQIADEFLRRAGLADRVDVRLGPALSTLAKLPVSEPFDLAFLDADKESNPVYLDWALKLVRPGGLIVADNVLRDGAVLAAAPSDATLAGVRRYNELVADHPRLEGLILFTRNGSWAVDGVSIARIRDEG